MFAVPPLPASCRPDQIADFLNGAEGAPWLDALAENYPHRRYDRCSSDRWDLKTLNSIAARIIDAKYADADVDEVVQGQLPGVCFQETWFHTVAPALRSSLHQFTGREPDDELMEAICYAWEDGAADQDASSPQDLFSSHERVELLFRLNTQPWLDDALVHSRRPWVDFGDLEVDGNLCFALAQMGYTLGEYRKASGNRNRAQGGRMHRRPRQRAPLLGMEKLKELVENACSTSFLFCLYAQVPIDQLFTIDLARPVTFEACRVATMDPINGTFFDVAANAPVTVKPQDGRFLSGGHLRWSPEDICGLVPSFYHGVIRN